MSLRVHISSNIARRRILKENKYLLAPVSSTGQEKNPIKVFNNHFRYKKYMKNEEWLNDSLKNIWNKKYLNLDEKTGFKILEYQNPAYSASNALNKDPRRYNNSFTVQIAGCDYRCLYCYVPYEVNQNIFEVKGEYFDSDEIVKNFLQTRKKFKELSLNVLRISGGNPTIVPEIILDITNIIKSKKLNKEVYIWVDSNLSTSKYMEKLGQPFVEAIKQKNIGIVGCFKGICANDFEVLTGCSSLDYEKQFDTVKYFLSTKCDLYLYLPALTYKKSFKNILNYFAKKLYRINSNLPKRVELLKIRGYPGSILNRKFWSEKNRHFPDNSQIEFHKYWYHKLLPSLYGDDYVPEFCCNVPLY